MGRLSFLLVLTLLAIAVVHIFLADLIDSQEENKKHLTLQLIERQAEIETLKKMQQQSHDLQAQLQFLLALHNKNIHAAQMFAQLINTVPTTVSLTQIKREHEVITIEGIAPSDLEIVNFMANIQQNALFDQPVLTALGPNNIGVSRERSFELRINQHE